MKFVVGSPPNLQIQPVESTLWLMAESQQIGLYKVLEPISAGSYGEMFLVEDDEGRKRALKRLKLEQVMDDKALEHFEREVKVLRSLDHEAVPRFIDSGLDDGGLPFLVQQYIRGDTLEEASRSGHRFDSRAARDLTRKLLLALDYLHGLHPPVIHRDIKPANIILAETGPVIVDFGAVCGQAVLSGEGSGTVVGTFGYMAPEQLQGQAAPTSDLYSLGATLLFCFTGREPESFPQERLKIQFRDQVKLPKALTNLLDVLLEPAAEDRPQSAQEALSILAGKKSSTALVKQKASLPAKKRRFKRLQVVAGATAVATTAAYLIMGHAAFVSMVTTVGIGIGIVLILFLIFISFVGGF